MNGEKTVLSPSQLVEVVREFNSTSPKPKHEYLAKKYNVTTSKIRGILLNQAHILRNYGDESTVKKLKRPSPPITKPYMPRERILKSRNILSLSERVKVIRDYRSRFPKPSFNSLATKYNVSYGQITNILLNQTEIFKLYRETRENSIKAATIDPTVAMEQQRKDKVDFLNKVIYEYILRTAYHGIQINRDMVLKKASEIKECIAIKDFRPTFCWFDELKEKFNIQDLELSKLRAKLNITEIKERQYSAVELVRFVRQQECMERANQIEDICDLELEEEAASKETYEIPLQTEGDQKMLEMKKKFRKKDQILQMSIEKHITSKPINSNAVVLPISMPSTHQNENNERVIALNEIQPEFIETEIENTKYKSTKDKLELQHIADPDQEEIIIKSELNLDNEEEFLPESPKHISIPFPDVYPMSYESGTLSFVSAFKEEPELSEPELELKCEEEEVQEYTYIVNETCLPENHQVNVISSSSINHSSVPPQQPQHGNCAMHPISSTEDVLKSLELLSVYASFKNNVRALNLLKTLAEAFEESS